MAAIYSTRFVICPAAATRTYVVPANHTAVVRFMSAVNSGASVATWYANILPSGIAFIGGSLAALNSPQTSPYYFGYDMRLVLNATETLSITTTGGVIVTASGYLFAA